MATFKITSPSGKSIKITGERPPTEKELNQIFNKVDPQSQPQKQESLGALSKFLGVSTSLGPVAGGIAGEKIAGPVGAGIGSFAGRVLPESAKAQVERFKDPEVSGLEKVRDLANLVSGATGIDPSGIQKSTSRALAESDQFGDVIKQAGKEGLTAAAISGAFRALRPGKSLTKYRNTIANKSKGVIKGDDVLTHVMDSVDDAPVTDKKRVTQYVLDAIDDYTGKDFSVSEAVAKKSRAWKAGFGAEKASKGAKAFVERAVGSALKKEIAKEAPNVAKLDGLVTMVIQTKKGTSRALWQLAKAGAFAGGLAGVTRLVNNLGI